MKKAIEIIKERIEAAKHTYHLYGKRQANAEVYLARVSELEETLFHLENAK